MLEEVRGKWLAREHAGAVSRPLPGIDYQDLIDDPGDAVVTRESLLGSCQQPLRAGFPPASRDVYRPGSGQANGSGEAKAKITNEL